MSTPTVGYTFVNGSASDATQVNSNFSDILNAMTDGLKDYNVLSVTAGTVTASTVTNLTWMVNTVTNSDATVTTSDGYRTINMSTGNTTRTCNLPAAASSTSRVITIKKIDSGTGFVTVDPNGTETIDGATTKTLYSQYDSVTLHCDGSNWFVLDEKKKRMVLSAHRNGSAQAGVNPNTSFAQITLNSQASSGSFGFSSLAGWSTANGNFVVPYTGLYRVSLRVLINATNVLANFYSVSLLKGATFGAATDSATGLGFTSPATTQVRLSLNATLSMTAGDTYWVGLFGQGNNSASTLTLEGTPASSGIEIEYIGDA